MTPTPTWPIFSHQDLENATRWALETAVPLSTELSSSPLEDFWKALRTDGDGHRNPRGNPRFYSDEWWLNGDLMGFNEI